MNGELSTEPRSGPIVNAMGWRRHGGHGSGTATPDAACFTPYAMPMTLWFSSRERRRTPLRKNLPWRPICVRQRASELSPEKTRVTAVTEGFEFLGFHVGMKWDKRYGYSPRVEIAKTKAADLLRKVKQRTQYNSWCKFGDKLQEINPILRGWANYYRYCARAGRVFTNIDWYVGKRLWIWLRRQRPRTHGGVILRGHYLRSQRRPTRRLWRDGSDEQHLLAWTHVSRFRGMLQRRCRILCG